VTVIGVVVVVIMDKLIVKKDIGYIMIIYDKDDDDVYLYGL